MPRYDWSCTPCDHVFEAFVSLADYPACAPCPTCGRAATKVHLPPRTTWSADPVVVYRAPDGSFRFPGDTGGSATAKYDRMGYERLEARGFAEVRRLESRMNAHESSQLRRVEERRLAIAETVDAARRSETRRGLEQGFQIPERRLGADGQIYATGRMTTVRMRPQGRDAMLHAMRQTEAKGHRRIGDTSIFVDAYSNSRSNRDEARGADGKRRRD